MAGQRNIASHQAFHSPLGSLVEDCGDLETSDEDELPDLPTLPVRLNSSNILDIAQESVSFLPDLNEALGI